MRNKTTLSIAASILAIGLASSATLLAQPHKPPADVLGLSFVGHHVSDLDKSIKFFEAIDFKVVEGPGKWVKDEAVNKLFHTPGAETRTAVMQTPSSVSDTPVNLVLRQFRGVPRQDWSKGNSWNLLASHIDMTVEGSVAPLLDKLEKMNMLVMPEIQGLPNGRTMPGDFRRFAFISDPDGLTIEYFGKAPEPPAQPLVSNSTAGANMDRWGKHAGFNHYATNVIDPQKAQDFYVDVLGGDFPELEGKRGESKQIMMHGWFPQANTGKNLRVELIYFAMNDDKTPPPVKLQDINANYAAFEVADIDSAYKRAKEHGAVTVTDGGIMDFDGGKAVMIRDSDVGGYILLWQPGK